MQQNMTQGNLAYGLVRFSVPLILSGILQQLYSWADAFIVGNVVGESALAAIGVTVTISSFLVLMITGFTAGTTVLSAQYFGNQNTAIQKNILATFALVLKAVFAVLALLCFVFARQFLLLLQTPSDILVLSVQYLRILICGIPCLAVYNVYAAVLSGIGNSKAPFYAVLVSSVVNVLLDVLFVAVLGFGVQGAAAATVLSQACMTGYLIYYASSRYAFLQVRNPLALFDGAVLRRGLRLSLPIALQSVITSAGNLLLQSFLNGFGTQTVAAITAAYRIDSMIMLPLINIGTAVSTSTAQNMGAGQPQRAKQSLRIGAALSCGVSVVLTTFVLFFGEALIALFGVSAATAAFGGAFFRAIALFYPVFGLSMVIRGHLEGRGEVVFTGACAIASLAVRVAGSYLLVGSFGNMTIAYAEMIAWAFWLLLLSARLVGKRIVKK